MEAIEAALRALAAGQNIEEPVMLRMTAHLGPTRGSESFALQGDRTAKSWAFVPAKGIGKQDPHRILGEVPPETLAEVANLLLAVGVHNAPADAPAPGGAAVELAFSVGETKASVFKPSFAIKNDPAWQAAFAKFEELKKSFAT